MVSKRKLLSGCKLYLILDAGVCSYDRLFEVLKAASQSGVDIVQLRDKVGFVKDILRLSKQSVSWLKGRVPFIVNDRVDIAKASGASGVHLGQDDFPVDEARRILGPRAIIGVSCQNAAHIRRALRERADYIGFGSVFKTLTKPERLPMDHTKLREAVRIAEGNGLPLFAIGGISSSNVGQVRDQDVRRVAVCRDIMLAEDTRRSVGELRAALNIKQ
ncbi:MAG: thiamine phosphate synthase [Candidatus Omnitrophota bacterium]